MNRVKSHSIYGKLENWCLKSVIVKFGDDCRQEFLAMQLIKQFKTIFDEANLPLYVRPYNILVNSTSSGLIEVVQDAISIHQLKKYYQDTDDEKLSLVDHFKRFYGTDNPKLHTAVKNFVRSLAGYSLVSYLLQLKDRHNGNILITAEGYIVHIDFGFMLSISPGGINAEKAPFKLIQEYITLMGGIGSPMYKYYKEMLIDGFIEVRKHHEKILLLVEMMSSGSKLPCMVGEQTIRDLKERFKLNMTEKAVIEYVETLITSSLDNWYTRAYDKYQYV